jgi:hypothetical protein
MIRSPQAKLQGLEAKVEELQQELQVSASSRAPSLSCFAVLSTQALC